jgi:hypothetical protein
MWQQPRDEPCFFDVLQSGFLVFSFYARFNRLLQLAQPACTKQGRQESPAQPQVPAFDLIYARLCSPPCWAKLLVGSTRHLSC